MDNKTIYDTIIIGSGPAGLTAGIYNVRADLKTVVLSGNQPGGQLTITTTVENFPGFPKSIGGTKLMMDTMDQYKNLGGEVKQGLVKSVRQIVSSSEDQGEKANFEVELMDGEIMYSKAVIVATGAAAKWLGITGEKELIGHGISGCATCDGMFFRNKIVAVIGGGDVAAEDADFVARFASKVYMIIRRDVMRAQIPQQKLVLNNPKIEIVWDTEVVSVNDKIQMSNDQLKLQNIRIKNNKTGEEKILEVDGMFVAIGRDPATGFVSDLVETKDSCHIVTGKDKHFTTMTSVPGIFAAGDCTDDNYRQAIVAAGDGCRAGLDAERWLKNSNQ